MDKNSKEYKNGFDAGLNGPNKENCHFSNFATPEQTKDWEAGQAAGQKAKKLRSDKKPRHNPRKK
jgi:ribosome modulation factor